MGIEFHCLNTSGKLDKYKNKIIDKAKESMNIIRGFIPIDNVDIVIRYSETAILTILGYSPDANTIYLSIDTQNQNIESIIDSQILRTLSHESHHCLRWRDPGYGETLYEAMVTEGLADHFDIEITGNEPQPWSIVLTDEKLQEMEQKAKAFYWSKYDHNLWFYGTNASEIPNWTGYSLGFKIIDEYLKISHEKPSKLFSKSAREIYNVLNIR